MSERVYLARGQPPSVLVDSKLTLNVDSNPRGANVSLNGQNIGTTPIAKKVEVGSYEVEISLAGYEVYVEAVYLTKNIGTARAEEVYANLRLFQPAVPVVTTPVAPDPPPVQPTQADGTIPVSKNSDWKPVERDFGGTTMVLVSAGSFRMGSSDTEIDFALELCGDNCKREWFEDEAPKSNQQFDKPFWIDKTEVTRGAYESCVTSRGM